MNDTNYRPSKMLAVARIFLDQPGQWVDADTLASVGGRYAWRTRVSEARRKLNMQIDNRLITGDGFTRSEYRYTPATQVL